MKSIADDAGLPLPVRRCLTRDQAGEYLGIGVTLLAELDVPVIKLGRRCVYDRVDLDAWLEEYKRRGRARKEDLSWPVRPASIGGGIPASGGSMSYCPTADAYAEALRPRGGKKQKPSFAG
jgi:hypothetical protein